MLDTSCVKCEQAPSWGSHLLQTITCRQRQEENLGVKAPAQISNHTILPSLTRAQSSTIPPLYTQPAYGMRQVYAWVAELAACSLLRVGFQRDRKVPLSWVVCCCAWAVCMSGQAHTPLQSPCGNRWVHYESPVGVCIYMWKVPGCLLTAMSTITFSNDPTSATPNRNIEELRGLLCIAQ